MPKKTMPKKKLRPKKNPPRSEHARESEAWARKSAELYNEKDFDKIVEGYAYLWVAIEQYSYSGKKLPDWVDDLKEQYEKMLRMIGTTFLNVRYVQRLT
jgi:hypothetical protein